MFTALKKTGKEALVVVDYQVDFVDGTLGFSGAQALEDGICAEIEGTRSAGNDVIFTFDTHSESADEYLNTPEGKALPIPHCLRGSKGHALYGKVADCVRPEDARIFKPTFGSEALAALLKARGYTKITFVGLVSNICVISNAILAKTACPNAQVRVLSALTASPDAELHKAALDVMRSVQIIVK